MLAVQIITDVSERNTVRRNRKQMWPLEGFPDPAKETLRAGAFHTGCLLGKQDPTKRRSINTSL